MGKQLLQWHPAFQAACRVELREDEAYLQFLEEHTLAKKPLQMDVLIIKLETGHEVKKSIGKIFRKHNIVEYKSPDDYISTNDFYKVMGYACIYQSNTKNVLEIPPADVTVTLVCSNYPRVMMNYIRKRYNIDSENVFPGIYHINGLLFPLQLVITKKLPKEEYTWLSRLHKDLDIESDIKPLAIAYKDNMWDPRYQAVMDLIIRANQEQYEEGMKMCEALRELFADELKEREEVGLERGALLKLISQVRKKIQKGLQVIAIAEILEEPEQLIRAIVQMMNKYPGGTDEDICGYLITEGAGTSVYGSSGK